jgi:ribulose-phosphate 3-epimerase
MGEPVLLSASILSADFARLGGAIREAESAGVDWIHIDVMDGHFVPNITMGPVVVQACQRSTGLPLDVHLMIEEPIRFLPEFQRAGADSITVHAEACTHLHRTLQAIRDLGCSAGVALNPATPASIVAEVLDLVDLVLVMSVNPGFAGQTFLASSLTRIGQVRNLLDHAGSQAHLQVDGGLTAETAPGVIEAGANVLAAASAIFMHPDGVGAGVRALRQGVGQRVSN